MTDALLADILQHPDDDAPRIVYADWLLERDVARGELIQIQCALAKLPETDPQHAELASQEAALLRTHGRRWLAELGITARTDVSTVSASLLARGNAVVFRRGFIDEAKLRFASHAAASAQLAQTPLRRSVVTRLAPDEVADLAALPVAPTLTGLVLPGVKITDAAATALAAAPLLDGLVELVLHDVYLMNRGLRILARSPRLGRLRSVVLSQTSIDKASDLIDSPWPAQLEALDLQGSISSDDVLWALFRAPGWRALRVLDLSNSHSRDAAVSAIAASKALSATLTHLNLRWTTLGDEAVQALVRSPRLAKLQVLNMEYGVSSNDHAVALRKRFGSRLVMR